MLMITDREFQQLADLVKSRYGINLKKEKKYLIIGRLQSVLAEKNLESYDEYYRYVMNDSSGDALQELVSRITTNHTFFMREKEHFEFLADTALPELVKIAERAGEKDLRIWSAGCSSGEEPYCLAMIIMDYMGTRYENWDTRVLATDISPRVLLKAEEGVYGEDHIASLPQRWRKSYFRKAGEGAYAIHDVVKKEVIFRRFNLMNATFPFKKKFHAIFCRNVMIYFDHDTKMELVRKFNQATETGGYLFVGQAESLGKHCAGYTYVIPSVYRKG